MTLRTPFLPDGEFEGSDFDDLQHESEDEDLEFGAEEEEVGDDEVFLDDEFADGDWGASEDELDDEWLDLEAIDTYREDPTLADEESALVEDAELADLETYESEVAWLESETSDGVSFPSGVTLRKAGGAVGNKQEHWDPHKTGNPLLDTSDRATKLSANFTVGELTQSGGRRFSVARIDPKLVACLQALRDHLGRPIVITSGYRSWGYNEEVYRRRNKEPTLSRHCSGQAVDIKIAGMDGMAIAKAAIDVCGTDIGVGIGSNYAHVDVRGFWAKWTYFSGSQDREAKAEIERHAASRRGSSAKPDPAGASTGASSSAGAATTGTAGIDVAHAIARNRVHSERLGWSKHRSAVARHLGFTDSTPDEGSFAEAVARWQASQGLENDGILGPSTWNRLKGAIGVATGSSGSGLRKSSGKYGGYSGYAGGRLDAAIRRLISAGLLSAIPERDIHTLQGIANIESRGLAGAVNTWDNAIVSGGFKQWTLHTGRLQELIAMAPDAFAKHGIVLDPTRKYKLRWGQFPAIQGVSDPNDLRSAEWSKRFLDASLEDEALVAAVRKALGDVAALEKRVRQWGWSEHLATPKARVLLAQLANNRPAYVKEVIPRLLKRASGLGLDEFLSVFVEEIITAYGRRNTAAKARKWTTKVMKSA